MTRRPWTDEEIGFLQDHADWTARRLAEETGRSIRAIESTRTRLRRGWAGRLQNLPWSEDEDHALIEAGHWKTAEALAEDLVGRTPEAIAKRRLQLGLVTARGLRPSDIAARPLVAKTCLECGQLLAGTWFTFNKKTGIWSATCRHCHSARSSDRSRSNRDRSNRYSRDSFARANRLTAERATRRGEPYAEADYKVLADPLLTDLQKALRLQRTLAGVTCARKRAGLKSKPDGLGDPERDVWVIDNPNLLMEASA